MRFLHTLYIRTRFTLSDGRTLSCVTPEPPHDDDPRYFLGLPHLAPLWWVWSDGWPDFGPCVDVDQLPKGLACVAVQMVGPCAYRFQPTVFDPSEPDI